MYGCVVNDSPRIGRAMAGALEAKLCAGLGLPFLARLAHVPPHARPRRHVPPTAAKEFKTPVARGACTILALFVPRLEENVHPRMLPDTALVK